MNRPGQPPQRPLNMGPAQGLAFRGPYPSTGFGLPPRNALQQQAFQGLPGHRTPGQNMVLPSPNFMQQRGQSGYPFGGALGQQQTQQAQQQQHPPSHQQSQSSLPLGQQQQQQPGASGVLPHLQGSALPSIQANTSAATEAALDPNDFPALGSTPVTSSAAVTTSSPATTLASSYASQAGTGASASGQGQAHVQSNAIASSVVTSQPRDFTPDDFPALGGQTISAPQQQQSQPLPQTSQNQQNAQDASHPPGLNGFEGRQPMPPGMLNLAAGQRNLMLDTEKRPTSKVATWNGTNASSSNQQNGSIQHNPQLGGPPGISAPFRQQQQQQSQQQAQQAYSSADGTMPSATQPNATTVAPQTPAQQILMSPADRWGLLGLLAILKNSNQDENLVSIGTDLGTMGLDMQAQGSLFPSFITPWSDSTAAHQVEPEFHLPQCYNVNPPPPGPVKLQGFTEETLFYMFYAHPRDGLQEVAAQELFARSWRWNKELRLWLFKDDSSNGRHTKMIEGGLGEQGVFTYWDPDMWEKGVKEFTVLYSDLEIKTTPQFHGVTLTLTAFGQQIFEAAQQQQQLQTQSGAGPAAAALSQQQVAGRNNFPTLAMTAAAM